MYIWLISKVILGLSFSWWHRFDAINVIVKNELSYHRRRFKLNTCITLYEHMMGYEGIGHLIQGMAEYMWVYERL